MASGGESKVDNTLWMYLPVRRSRTYRAERARSFLQRRTMMVSRSEPILEHERSDAQCGKPFRDWSFFAIGQMGVASTRANDDCCAGRLLFRSEVRSQSRNVA